VGGQPTRFGTLSITVVAVRDLKPSAVAGKSDPYVKVKIGAMEKLTKVINNAANNPTYDETFSFSISTEKEVAVRGGVDGGLPSCQIPIAPCPSLLARRTVPR
jgi:hypothetical protein